ncbi:MAG: acetyl-CoA decarbonylase/synthase complex subunit delta [Candidatus Omnitrophica bacterium]|nr:acetyl-CoA decarbonylase/synthase complex subunit delta [Candidatus Omnitrophota bacterium]
MVTPLMLEKWSGKIAVLTIGATREDGGSRAHVIKIGGQQSLPFLFQEGPSPHRPVIAFEVWDVYPQDWQESLQRAYVYSLKDPIVWAKTCVEDYNEQILCLRLQGIHPDYGNKSADTEAEFIKELLKKVDVPLIIIGSGDDVKDNAVLPICCEAARGERCLIGSAVQDNYKTLVASVLADGHNIIAESPIDINIAKQLNILISDMGLSLERIAINPTIGALGYGLEYAYSIMERCRLAALSGDKTLASPFICFVGQEAWRAKESKVNDDRQGIVWEVITATALLQAGADILVMRHPEAISKVNSYIANLFRE